MRKGLLFLALATSLFAAGGPLKTGVKYDFIAIDGQHVYNAELVKETEAAYTVKTEGFGSEILEIEKSALSGPPRPVTGKQPKDTVAGRSSRVWRIDLAGELRMASGAFSDYALFFPGFSASLSRKIGQVPYLGFSGLTAFLQYAPIARSPRRIDIITTGLLPKWSKRFRKLPRIGFYAVAGPTLSFLKYDSYTFSSSSFNGGFVASLGADWALGPNWSLTASLGTHYIYDKSTFVLMHNLSLGISYAW